MIFPFLAAVLLAQPSNRVMPMVIISAQTAAGDSAPVKLDSLRDRYRPLLVFTPNVKDERFLRQLHLFAARRAEMDDRQILFVAIPNESPARTLETAPKRADTVRLTSADAADVRRRFQVAQREFAVILVGKDGGEKFRTHNPVTIDRLNALIDAMPMRQQEVQNGHSK